MAFPDTHPSRDDGLRLLLAGEIDASIRCLNEVLEADPTDVKAFSYLGAAYAQKGEMDEAVAAFWRAVELSPTYKVYFNFGLACELAGRMTEALQAFTLSLTLNPGYAPAVEAAERVGALVGPLEPSLVGDIPEEPVEPPEELYSDFRATYKRMLLSGLIYGAVIGIVWAEALFLLPSLLLPRGVHTFGSVYGLIPVLAVVGAVIGAVTGVCSALTGGGEETGVKFGLILGVADGVFMALAGGASGATIALVLLIAAVLGILGGYVIGLSANERDSQSGKAAGN